MFRFLATASIWLSAALVPLQGFPGHACCCAGETSREATASCESAPRNVSSQSCCCKHGPGPVRSRHTCCSAAQAPQQHYGCTCGPSCQCQHGNQKPAEDRAPSPHDRTATDQIAEASECFMIAGADSQVHSTQSSSPAAAEALHRCALLCRFRL